MVLLVVALAAVGISAHKLALGLTSGQPRDWTQQPLTPFARGQIALPDPPLFAATLANFRRACPCADGNTAARYARTACR